MTPTIQMDPPVPRQGSDLPAAFSLFEDVLEMLPAGAPGKVGTLRLNFAYREGKTRLTDVYATGPQRVHHVLYIDENLPDMALAIIQSVGGGILQGDRVAVEIVVEPGARAMVTTQSATKVYKMEANYATNCLSAVVGEGGYLELLTDYQIPYAGVRLYNRFDFTVDDGGTLIYTDGIAPGRVAHGESFAYKLIHSKLRVRDGNGELRLADTTVLEPDRIRPARPGILGPYTDLGSLYAITPGFATKELSDTIHAEFGLCPEIEGSASVLPRGDGLIARVLGSASSPVQAAVHHAWRLTRRALLNVDVPKIHSIKYGFEPSRPTTPITKED